MESATLTSGERAGRKARRGRHSKCWALSPVSCHQIRGQGAEEEGQGTPPRPPPAMARLSVSSSCSPGPGQALGGPRWCLGPGRGHVPCLSGPQAFPSKQPGPCGPPGSGGGGPRPNRTRGCRARGRDADPGAHHLDGRCWRAPRRGGVCACTAHRPACVSLLGPPAFERLVRGLRMPRVSLAKPTLEPGATQHLLQILQWGNWQTGGQRGRNWPEATTWAESRGAGKSPLLGQGSTVLGRVCFGNENL